MLLGINKNEVVEFISALEKDKENPTVFLLGVLTGEERFILVARWEETQDPKILYEIVKKGLRGIRNIKVGEEARSYDTITDEAMEVLPTNLVKELFLEIIKLNYLSENERKN